MACSTTCGQWLPCCGRGVRLNGRRLRVMRILGEGAYAQVYQARWLVLLRVVPCVCFLWGGEGGLRCVCVACVRVVHAFRCKTPEAIALR